MRRHAVIALYVLVLVLVAVVVSVDTLFFRHQLWERLIVNVGIVFVFATLYLKLTRRFGARHTR